mmetsp:Transcript_13232/g.31536  ORF Transcript_13232/g.31536 Transcript_13232/m.31536 type:complete len:296 (+) Transcript_13232:77-964(+)
MGKAAEGGCMLNLLNLAAFLVNLGITYGSLTGAFGPTNSSLSAKYHTLITPSGFAFSIWGPIFIWEGVFAVAQMFPSYRGSMLVKTITPWWLSACLFQCAWTLFFAQEIMIGAMICMAGILISLMVGILRLDFLEEMSTSEYWLLRAPFSLHCGWIVAATSLNICVVADYYKGPPEVMLALAMVCFAGISAIVTVFTFASPKADPIIALVACWALLGMVSELTNAEKLRDATVRWNYFDWPQYVISAVRIAAFLLSLLCIVAATVATARRVCFAQKRAPEPALGEGVLPRSGTDV